MRFLANVRFDVGLGGDGKREKIYMYSILRRADESTKAATTYRQYTRRGRRGCQLEIRRTLSSFHIEDRLAGPKPAATFAGAGSRGVSTDISLLITAG